MTDHEATVQFLSCMGKASVLELSGNNVRAHGVKPNGDWVEGMTAPVPTEEYHEDFGPAGSGMLKAYFKRPCPMCDRKRPKCITHYTDPLSGVSQYICVRCALKIKKTADKIKARAS